MPKSLSICHHCGRKPLTPVELEEKVLLAIEELEWQATQLAIATHAGMALRATKLAIERLRDKEVIVMEKQGNVGSKYHKGRNY